MYDKLRRNRRLDAVQSGCSALSIVKQGTSWSSPTSMTLGLFWVPHLTTTSSRRPAHHPPEAQPAPQPRVISTQLSCAFDDYYIEDCDVILVPEVTQRRTDNNDQFVILAIVGVAFVPACL
ncbi:hypothetical protein ZEAMMB73_Zm00001d039915 [Zea mays]|uniref:Uncharacterized protein n=1 Tax=Zea mays TaxID=4577 RepID=A0A1D6MLR9_MAIZE|nr:hypothetical protein ZEAMMB73_Zm00001d039915 [Zea mays]